METSVLVSYCPDHILWRSCYSRVLVCMDRMISSVLGRPCAIQDEEYVSPLHWHRGLTPLLLALMSTFLWNVMTSTGIILTGRRCSSSPQISRLSSPPSTYAFG